MRKPLAILMIIVLLVGSMGLTVQKHYCMSRHIATLFIPSVQDACGMEMPPGHNHCKDHLDSYKVDSPQFLTWFDFDASPTFEWLTNYSISSTLDILSTDQSLNLFADINPPPSEPGIYTRVQSFLL